jgi:hypothetical protein
MFLFLTFQVLHADERRFTYIYQSTIVAKGEKEIEIWTTPSLGKNTAYYARLDNRLEFEIGLSKKLQTAFYINFSNTTTDNGTGVNTTQFEFGGISSEWKYNFTSLLTDAAGFALYSEIGLNTNEVDLETKLILEKRFNKTILAFNFTFEPEWQLTPSEAETETKIETSFGLSHSFSSSLHAGFELRQHNVFNEGGLEHSAFFGGPVISFTQPEWWATLTIMPQIVGFKGKSEGSSLNLSEYEKLQARLVFSFHL